MAARLLLTLLLGGATALAQSTDNAQQQVARQLEQGDFKAAVATARSCEPEGLRLSMLGHIARAHASRHGYGACLPSYDAVLQATREVANINERLVRLASLAWFHERQLANHASRRKGDVLDRTAAVIAEAARLLPDTDPAGLAAMIRNTSSKTDQIYSRMVVAMVRSQPHADMLPEVGRELFLVSSVINRVEQPEQRVFLLVELANMETWLGDVAAACSNLGKAAREAAKVESVEARMKARRAVADSQVTHGSMHGLQEVVPGILEDLQQLPARYAPGKARWLLEIARLQDKVGAEVEIVTTLDKFDEVTAIVTEKLGAARTAASRDEAALLRLTNSNPEGFLKYAKARFGETKERNAYLDERIRWLLGLPSSNPSDLASSLLGRKPERGDFLTGIRLLAAIEIEHEPFNPRAKQPQFAANTNKATRARDRLARAFVERAAEQGQYVAAWLVTRRIVQPTVVADALITLGEHRVAAGEKQGVRDLVDALVCFDIDKREMLLSRGEKASRIAAALHRAGEHERAMATLARLRPLVAVNAQVAQRIELAVYLIGCYHEIGEPTAAHKFAVRLVELSKQAKDPRKALNTALTRLRARDQSTAAKQLREVAAAGSQ